MIAKDIMNYLENYFPLSLQLSFDKCGLQVGNSNQDVHKIMVSLNCDQATINKAIENNCTMIISHHPLLLEKHSAIDTNLPFGKFVEKAIKHNIVVYSLHTCLDIGKDGISMNDWLLSLFDVKNIESYDEEGVGKKAILRNPLPIKDFLHLVKEVFELGTLKYAAKDDLVVNTIAICGGSGSDDIAVVSQQVDAYITGDTKYHHGQYAIERDMALIDVGHHVEVIVEKKLKELLEVLDLEVITCNALDYFTYY